MKHATLAIEALRDVVASLPDDRLAPIRRAALDRLQDLGLPTLRDEDWKYTDLASIIDVSNDWLKRGGERAAGGRLSELTGRVRASIEADWVVIANGEVVLPEAADCDFSLLSQSGGEIESRTALAYLNTALLRDGLVIRIDEAREASRPVGILIVDEAPAAGGVSQARVDIEFLPGSCGSIIEFHASRGGNPHFANTVVDLVLGQGAQADYLRIQDRDFEHTQTGRLDVRMGQDSRFRHAGFDIGGALVRNDLCIGIDSPGAAASFDGLYLAGDGQHVDNHTRVDHRVGPAESRQEYRGILTGNARCVWNGKAIVHAGADGTDAAQANHNLLLSEKAEIDAKPELEIYADDVKCSHGTTVGQLDEAALYYLRTRGLDRQFARRMLTHAFARTIADHAPVENARDALKALIEARLESLLEERRP